MTNYDVIIVGGGVMGASVAYHLFKDGFKGNVAVFEKDKTYEFASTVLSEGSFRRSFSSEVNVRLSDQSLKAYKNFEKEMSTEEDPITIDLIQNGYFYLLKDDVEKARSKFALKEELGIKFETLTPEEVKNFIPELNIDGLSGALYEPEGGSLDSYSVLQGYVKGSKRLGAEYIYKGVKSILTNGDNQITGVETLEGEEYYAPIVVNACGAWSGELSDTIGVEMPVKPLRRQIFSVDLASEFKNPIPFVHDPSGAHFRPEGDVSRPKKLIIGKLNDVPYGFNFRLEKSYFENEIWPLLAERAPIFEALKVESGWAGLYDYNYIDQNGIIGGHSKMNGYYYITGFSGHGIQQAPAAGRGLAELIRLGKYETIDLSALSVERFEKNELIIEEAVL